MKILITAGATREPIDSVRFITNFSSGKTGAEMADTMQSMGHKVFYLHGINAVKPKAQIPCQSFAGFTDLNAKIKSLIKKRKFDAIVHLAAVSDYSVDRLIIDGKTIKPDKNTKIDSSKNLTIKLRKNFKIADKLADYTKPKKTFITVFKLTSVNSEKLRTQIAKEYSLNPHINLVVHNDLQDIKKSARKFGLFAKGKLATKCEGTFALAKLIIKEKQNASCS